MVGAVDYGMIHRCWIVIGLLFWACCVQAQSVEEWFGLGVNAMNAGNIDRAIECFTKGLEADASSVSTRFNRATLLLRQRRYGEALADLDECKRRQPGRIAVHMQRAVVLAELGRTAEALDEVEAIVAADSTFPKARLLLGRLQVQSGDTVRGCASLLAVRAAGDASAERFLPASCVGAVPAATPIAVGRFNRTTAAAVFANGIVRAITPTGDSVRLDDARLAVRTAAFHVQGKLALVGRLRGDSSDVVRISTTEGRSWRTIPVPAGDSIVAIHHDAECRWWMLTSTGAIRWCVDTSTVVRAASVTHPLAKGIRMVDMATTNVGIAMTDSGLVTTGNGFRTCMRLRLPDNVLLGDVQRIVRLDKIHVLLAGNTVFTAVANGSTWQRHDTLNTAIVSVGRGFVGSTNTEGRLVAIVGDGTTPPRTLFPTTRPEAPVNVYPGEILCWRNGTVQSIRAQR